MAFRIFDGEDVVQDLQKTAVERMAIDANLEDVVGGQKDFLAHQPGHSDSDEKVSISHAEDTKMDV